MRARWRTLVHRHSGNFDRIADMGRNCSITTIRMSKMDPGATPKKPDADSFSFVDFLHLNRALLRAFCRHLDSKYAGGKTGVSTKAGCRGRAIGILGREQKKPQTADVDPFCVFHKSLVFLNSQGPPHQHAAQQAFPHHMRHKWPQGFFKNTVGREAGSSHTA